jgi:hypothetical protein
MSYETSARNAHISHDSHESNRSGKRAAATAPNGLTGTIAAVTLFGQNAALDSEQTGYLGAPLFVTSATVDKNGVMTVAIDDLGPPATSFPTSATSAIALVSLSGAQPSQSGKVGITYGGKPLNISAAVTPAPSGKWKRSAITPQVTEWTLPTGGLEFVILQPDPVGTPGDYQLRWLVDPVQMSVTSSSTVVPPAAGTGVAGPFGLETP